MTPVSIVRSSNTVTSAPKAKISFTSSPSPSFSRLTAHRAATIEPTIQKMISKVRAPQKRPNSNSTMLSTIGMSFRLQCVCLTLVYSTNRRTDCDRTCALRDSNSPNAVTIDNGPRAVLFPRCLLNHCKRGSYSWWRVIFILDRGIPTVGEAKGT